VTQSPNLAIFTIEAHAVVMHRILESPLSQRLITLELLVYDGDALDIIKILQNTLKLNYLYIEKCNMTLEDALALQSHPSLREILIRECKVTDEVMEILLLSETLESISIGHTLITGTCLSVAQYNNTLKELHVYDCTELEIDHVYNYIANNSTLTKLNLEGGPELDSDLWHALKDNTVLSSLYCPMHDSDQDRVVLDVLKYSTNLTKLSFINEE
jgi:hypothetical protein